MIILQFRRERMTFVAENAKGDKDAPSYFGGGHLTSTQYWTKLFV